MGCPAGVWHQHAAAPGELAVATWAQLRGGRRKQVAAELELADEGAIYIWGLWNWGSGRGRGKGSRKRGFTCKIRQAYEAGWRHGLAATAQV